MHNLEQEQSHGQFKTIQSAPEIIFAHVLQSQSEIELTVAQITISNCCKSWTGLYTVRIPSE